MYPVPCTVESDVTLRYTMHVRSVHRLVARAAALGTWGCPGVSGHGRCTRGTLLRPLPTREASCADAPHVTRGSTQPQSDEDRGATCPHLANTREHAQRIRRAADGRPRPAKLMVAEERTRRPPVARENTAHTHATKTRPTPAPHMKTRAAARTFRAHSRTHTRRAPAHPRIPPPLRSRA